MTQKRAVVTGAGGFIGHHLVKRLKSDGYYVRGVDVKYPEYEETYADEFFIADLRKPDNCSLAVNGMDDVYQLAADMGGIGYITSHLSDVAHNNVLINVNMLQASVEEKVQRYLYTSSACVYAQSKQHEANVVPLKEEDAYPADPEPGYGWEKLFAEQMCEYYRKDFGLDIRVVRFHNVYGPLGTYDGGREKSPAALCRKVATAQDGTLSIWGDGCQTRSYMYIDDCVEGLRRLMESGYQKPLNLGTEELLTINEQACITCNVAGKTLELVHDLNKPQGVRGRNSDNTLLREVLKWEPKTTFFQGLEKTYPWIRDQVCSLTNGQ